ncbi:MAG TPA: DMT family transporter [Streptosporangiaceae bacterium]|jgi:hypothetical protein
MTWIAVALAVAGACCYAVGARRQNTAVREPGRTSLSLGALVGLVRDPGWLIGLLLLGAGTALHVTAVTLAPLTVVQPIGALALALTAILHVRAKGVRLNPASVTAIVACIGGIGAFVLLATGAVHPAPITAGDELKVLGLLAAAAVVLGTVIAVRPGRLGHTVAAGVAFGFVATLTRVLTQRFREGGIGDVSPLVVLGIVAAILAGGWCVQQAHVSGPPDLVVAGLTVIDPMVAVGIGIAVLGEAPHLHTLTMIALAGAAVVAAGGVVVLARHHPDAAGDAPGRTASTPGRHTPAIKPHAHAGRARAMDTSTHEIRSIL